MYMFVNVYTCIYYLDVLNVNYACVWDMQSQIHSVAGSRRRLPILTVWTFVPQNEHHDFLLEQTTRKCIHMYIYIWYIVNSTIVQCNWLDFNSARSFQYFGGQNLDPQWFFAFDFSFGVNSGVPGGQGQSAQAALHHSRAASKFKEAWGWKQLQ